ncbi:MAG: RNA 2',3'-cyclic phosphodiesterase [Chloroflexota bacterium]|nr:RNA 2',3'-cyclic phosphodiesterase [Chloroflexota bacterium]
MTEWRCFIAVPIRDQLRAALSSAVDAWRGSPGTEDLRWTDASGWHATLAFLGSTDPRRVHALADTLADLAARFAPFTLATGGLGGFPSARAARVVWYGIEDPEGRLAAVASAVRQAVGLADDQPFRAHLTLARARGQGRARMELAAPAPAGTLRVDELVLYRSLLGQGPALYEPLAVARLGVPVIV